MDAGLGAATRALSLYDPLTALKYVGLREDPPAIALRGIALAQLGDFPLARKLLRKAAAAFGPTENAVRARTLAAEAEIALAARDLARAERSLVSARDALAECGDVENAFFVRLQLVRRQILLGDTDGASAALDRLERVTVPARLAVTVPSLARQWRAGA